MVSESVLKSDSKKSFVTFVFTSLTDDRRAGSFSKCIEVTRGIAIGY
jgi:hypothetical protein